MSRSPTGPEPAGYKVDEFERLVNDFFAFVHADTWDEALQFVSAHAELMSTRALDMLQQVVDVATLPMYDAVARRVRAHLLLLRRSSEIGVEAAFSEDIVRKADVFMRPNHAYDARHVNSVLVDLVGADDLTARRAVLQDHPELLSDFVDSAIGAFLAEADEQLADAETETMRRCLRLLRRCRESGIEEAFADEAVQGELDSSVFGVAERLRSALGPKGDPGLRDRDRATLAAHELISHPGIGSLLEKTRAEFLDLAAVGLHLAYTSGDASAIDASLAASDEALRLTPPSSPRRPGYLTNHAAHVVARYRQRGELGDLSRAAVDLEEALNLTQPTAVTRLSILSSHAALLGDLYSCTGEAAHLDDALADWDSALALAPSPSPQRADLLNRRAISHLERYEHRGQTEDLNCAIEDVAEALLLAPSGTRTRSACLDTRARILSQRYARTGDRSDIERARLDLDEALAATDENDPNRNRLLNSRSRRLRQLFEISGDEDLLARAIDDINSALGKVKDGGPDRAFYLSTRSGLLYVLSERSGDAGDLSQALADVDAALAFTPLGSPERPRRLNDRSAIFVRRFSRTGVEADLDQALIDLGEVLKLVREGSPERPGYLNNRATCLLDRYLRSGNTADLDQALSDINAALAATPGDSPDFAAYLFTRSNILSEQAEATQSLTSLSASLAELDRALASVAEGSGLRLAILNNRSNRYASWYERTGSLSHLDAAIEDIRSVLAATPQTALSRVGRLGNLASLLARRHQHTDEPGSLEGALAAYREACTIGQGTAPTEVIKAARNWSHVAQTASRWVDVADAGEFGLAATHDLVQAQIPGARRAKESWLRDAEGLAARAVYAWVRRGDGPMAAITAERGRAVLLGEAISVRASLAQLRLAGHSDLASAYESAASQMASIGAGPGDREGEAHAGKDRQRKGRQDLECAIDSIRQVSCFESFLMRQSEEALLDAMKAAATEQPLLYLLAGELGGVALILRSDGTVSCFDLPRLTSAALSVLVQGDVSQPVTAIDLISHALWPLVGASLAEILEREQIVATTVIPLGALGMVPLHAAWTEDPRRPTGRLHLCDMVRFSYAPSAQALRNATTARSVDAQSILAVDDPQPSLGPPLTASAAEVTNAVSWFTTKTVIGRHDATKAAVIAALGKADVVHFSCHGSAVEIDPLQSFLALSDGRLTLGDLLGVDLADTRLVVLSACETARPGTTLLDEVISLPTGLLQVGVRASIGSLWSVEQNATAVLLSRFYELWRGEGIALAEALHQAQVWVRDSTEQEIRTSYPRIPVRSGGSPDCRPYSSPFWWAAFTVTGA